MEGVTILSETTKWTADTACINGAIVFFIMAGIALFIAAVIWFKNKDAEIVVSLAAVFLVSAILCITVGNTVSRHNYTEYKVTISEDVKFQEFYNKFEILEQEGDIFTVKERE
jgi:membrane protein YdbS with pleckstrin-like domain